MVFSSPIFLFLFLPTLLALHFVVGKRLRNALLLAASLVFYSWGEELWIAILLASIALNYVFGLLLARFGKPHSAATVLMAVAVMTNLGLLIAFKYSGFLVENLNRVLARLHMAPVVLGEVHLPLGISFFTFHALSYVIDVYRQEVQALRNPLNFALYISFFPQSIAGPIVRYNDVASQLVERTIDVELFAAGVKRFIVGLAKKMVLANAVAGPADAIFSLPTRELTPGLAWLGIVCYTLQIYFDFSGYSDMAIGMAKLFGFRLGENFNHPYVARSITEFWRRWHISLSIWYRDYLYIPLGGNRCGLSRLYFNLVTVFCLCGLWHGASWTFLLWGLFHGTFLVFERSPLGRRLASAPVPFQHAYAILIVMVGWVFFRAPTWRHALSFLGAMAGHATGSGLEYYPALYLNAELNLVLIAGVVCSIPVLPALGRLRDRLLAGSGEWGGVGTAVQTAFAVVPVASLLLLIVSAMLLAAGTYNPFIYFRF
jgi:alginate O-acetyltransferase complex protein AlgI